MTSAIRRRLARFTGLSGSGKSTIANALLAAAYAEEPSHAGGGDDDVPF